MTERYIQNSFPFHFWSPYRIVVTIAGHAPKSILTLSIYRSQVFLSKVQYLRALRHIDQTTSGQAKNILANVPAIRTTNIWRPDFTFSGISNPLGKYDLLLDDWFTWQRNQPISFWESRSVYSHTDHPIRTASYGPTFHHNKITRVYGPVFIENKAVKKGVKCNLMKLLSMKMWPLWCWMI